jgi:CheY-like chemotaxis protein
MACPQSIRVLLIDDEESVRLGMQALLEELGCIVELAAGTTQALTICRQRPVDLLIADFRLRDNDDGISAIRAARQIIPGLPALLLTGETAPNRLREAQEAGIPVLHKPASAPLLVHEISKISPLKRRTYDGEPDARSG